MKRRRLLHLTIWPLVTLVLVLLLVAVVLVKPVAGHTGLFSASPAPGATVGGVFTDYQLVFNEKVTEVDAWIETADGTAVGTATMVNTSGSVITFRSQPLTDDGIYIVRYTLVSADGDPIRSGYNFNYDSAAPAPLPASVPVQSGSDGLTNLAVALAITSVAALALLFLWRTWKVRQLEAQLEPVDALHRD